MIKSYQGQVCLITGASSGIGAAFARELAQRGAKVVLLARREDKLQAVAASLAPADYLVVVGDVTQAADRARVVEATLQQFGRIDVLINNAGRGEGGADFLHLDAATIEAVLMTNLLSVVHLTHLVVPIMVEGGGGLIINVSSPMGKVGLPRRTLYTVSKAGLSAMSQTLRRELYAYHIQVVDCLPGFTRSEMISPTREAELPRFLPVKDAQMVVIATLEGALRGQAEVMTAGWIARLGIWLNKLFPRLGDWLLRSSKF